MDKLTLVERIDQMGAVGPIRYAEHRDAIMADVRELERKANRWDGFIGCARISLFGSAGFSYETGLPTMGDYVHFGADFWTTHPDCAQPLRDETTALITAFADASYRVITKTKGST